MNDATLNSFAGLPRPSRALALAALIPFFAINSFSIQRSLVGLDFGDLMKIKVSSVERREKDLLQTAAAVRVISADEIRRSGATNIPDLLRGVAGLSVARVNGNNWAISARGGQSTLSNKLLVMIDGRSVYTPLFAGVFWDVQDIPLESIKQIEIIRGPGGTVWGANAVNGVINIIRKSPEEALGTVASVTSGTEDRFIGNVETAWKAGKKTTASAYGRYREFDDLQALNGAGAGDQGHQGGGGFRIDGKANESASWIVSSDAYGGQFFENRTNPVLAPVAANVPIHVQTDVDGMNAMVHWTQELDAAGAVSFQSYYDRTHRRIPQIFEETRNTLDLTAQHQIPVARVHLFTYGAGFRTTTDRVGNTLGARFEPDRDTANITNLFVQDEMQLLPFWNVNIGTKFEHNTYTGWEAQPSIRSAWEFTRNNVLWGSVSRAIRTPTRLDRDVKLQSVISAAPPALLSAQGTDNFVSEKLTAYEIGYRGRPVQPVLVGLTGFYNVYDHLRGAGFGPSYFETDPAPAHVVVPLLINNDLRGETYGAELAPRFKVSEWWTVRAAYGYLHQRLHVIEGGNDIIAAGAEVTDPVHQASLRSSWDIGPRVEFDAGVRWVGKVQAGAVDDYTEADARAAFKATDALTFEIVGQNLLNPYHVEFTGGERVERLVYGKTTWRFH